MTYRDRQRLRAARARRTAPAETKWPETIEELNSLPSSATSPVVTDSAAVRARLAQNARQSLQALQSLQISTSPAAQLSLFNSNQDNIPSPEPGPPPDYGQTPEPSPTPQPNQTQGTVAYSKYGMIDPGVAIAQQIMEKRNKDLKEWGQTAATAPALGLPIPPVPPMPGVQASKPSGGQADTSSGPTGSHGIYGWTEWDVPAAVRIQWENEHDPEYYVSEYDDMDLTPGDTLYKNPYGIDVDNFLHWVYSQIDYNEKGENKNLNSIGDAGGHKNWTKYGDWYGINGDYKNEDGSEHLAPWCAMFAAWCAHKAGISKDDIPQYSSTNDYIKWYSDPSRNRFMPKGTYKPKAGDMILYRWKEDGVWRGHTGIVVAYSVETDKNGNEKEYAYTIEGNLEDKVYFRQVPLNKSNLVGFGKNGGSSNGIVPPHYISENGKMI